MLPSHNTQAKICDIAGDTLLIHAENLEKCYYAIQSYSLRKAVSQQPLAFAPELMQDFSTDDLWEAIMEGVEARAHYRPDADAAAGLCKKTCSKKKAGSSTSCAQSPVLFVGEG